MIHNKDEIIFDRDKMLYLNVCGYTILCITPKNADRSNGKNEGSFQETYKEVLDNLRKKLIALGPAKRYVTSSL